LGDTSAALQNVAIGAKWVCFPGLMPPLYLVAIASRARNIMKNSKKCGKCQSLDIIRVPGEVAAIGNNIKLGGFSFWSVPVTRYVCATCGFTEEWVDAADDIAKVKRKYAS
jgi:hypothetical protein